MFQLKTSTAFLMFAFTLCLSNGAQASWVQTYCSNGEGTVRISRGHNDNGITITERTYNSGNVTEQTITDSNTELTYAVLDEKKLKSESNQACVPQSEFGFSTWKILTAQTVQISKADGGLFSANTLGVSADRKSVHAMLICEENGNSEMFCEKK